MILTTIHCVVFKGKNKSDSYLYIEEVEGLSRVPESLLEMLGELELVMELDLGPARKLAQADTPTVMKQLKNNGYYLQMPSCYYINML